jgi:chloramphenicol-sensitive protein RarD
MMRDTKHYVAVVAASTIWGLFAFVLKPLARWPPQDILFNRVFLSAILMVVMGLLLRRKAWVSDRRFFEALSRRDRRRVVWQALGGGFFLTFNWFFYIYVMNAVSIKAASLAYLVCPILTTVLAFFFLGERPTRRQWAAVGLSVTGCLVLAFGHSMDLVYSMAIAIFYAFYLVTQRRDYGTDKVNLLTVQVVFSALLLLPFYPFFSGPAPTAAVFYILISVIAIFLTIIPLLLSLYGLKRLSSSTVGIILYINPLMSFVIAVSFYGEKIDMRQAAAYGIVLLSIVLFNWPNGTDRGGLAGKNVPAIGSNKASGH